MDEIEQERYVDPQFKIWRMEDRIREELKNPNFLDGYTRKTLREVMIVLYPHVAKSNRMAFMDMTKNRMYRHLLSRAVLKRWKLE